MLGSGTRRREHSGAELSVQDRVINPRTIPSAQPQCRAGLRWVNNVPSMRGPCHPAGNSGTAPRGHGQAATWDGGTATGRGWEGTAAPGDSQGDTAGPGVSHTPGNGAGRQLPPQNH